MRNISDMLGTLIALAEPNRFRIVELLRTGPQPVGEIGDALGLRQPQVSKHLRVLKDAGLVEVLPSAQQRFYELRGAPLRELHGWLEQYRELWVDRFSALEGVIEELKRKQHVQSHRPHKRKTTSTKKDKHHDRKAK
jgi:DNA-binding transcriptional ArsR family regulator